MKRAFILILLAVSSLTACKKDANDTAYDKSYKAWQNFKAESKNSYSYTVNAGSVFGYGSETKIIVQNGVVVTRDFLSYSLVYPPNGVPGKTIREQWHEDKASLGQHSSGATLLTLDQVYQKAKTEWLAADKKKNTIYFESNNNGMISNASYVPNGCQDDCSTGISISEIKAL
jgi:molybdopterin converting factor small subunit